MKNFFEELKRFLYDSEEAEEVIIADGRDEVRMTVFDPRSIKDAFVIAGKLKEGTCCLVTLHKLPEELRNRVLDFLDGVSFGINGSVNLISNDVILYACHNVDVSKMTGKEN